MAARANIVPLAVIAAKFIDTAEKGTPFLPVVFRILVVSPHDDQNWEVNMDAIIRIPCSYLIDLVLLAMPTANIASEQTSLRVQPDQADAIAVFPEE